MQILFSQIAIHVFGEIIISGYFHYNSVLNGLFGRAEDHGCIDFAVHAPVEFSDNQGVTASGNQIAEIPSFVFGAACLLSFRSAATDLF